MRQVERIRQRLANEEGLRAPPGRRAVALAYPSPYPVGMSSLGFQQVFRLLCGLDDTGVERAFLPDPDFVQRGPVLTYESQRPLADFPVIAFSVAYELEITGLFAMLASSGVPLSADERTERHPYVIAGGPLTFSNPLPLAPFVDAVVLGEAEELLAPLLAVLFGGLARPQALDALAELPGIWVPSRHGEVLPQIAQCNDTLLPAHSAIITPDTALSNMFLVEAERGCSRGCTFCVMRRSTNGGMRLVPQQRILATLPAGAKRVGLVGAAVSDHPRIADIVGAIVERGCEVGLSSLRADRLTDTLVANLVRGGVRTLTVASDAASERLRQSLQKKIREKHLLRTAALAREHGILQLKNYMIVGLPDEAEADLDELVDFTLRQAQVAGPRVRVSLGVATLVAKRNTPLDGAPFVGVREAERRIERLRRALAPKVEVRPTSARWAWVEYQLAQGGAAAGLAALVAWQGGGSFAAWKRAFGQQGGDEAALPRRAYDGPTGYV